MLGGLHSVCFAADNLDEDLRHSQLCAKAAREFRNEPRWKDGIEGRTFTSHFNKKMGKCLVKATSSQIVEEQRIVLEMNHVYDALEGTILGGEILRKELSTRGREQKVLTITMVRDGKMNRPGIPGDSII
jgi:hypothetical protein